MKEYIAVEEMCHCNVPRYDYDEASWLIIEPKRDDYGREAKGGKVTFISEGLSYSMENYMDDYGRKRPFDIPREGKAKYRLARRIADILSIHYGESVMITPLTGGRVAVWVNDNWLEDRYEFSDCLGRHNGALDLFYLYKKEGERWTCCQWCGAAGYDELISYADILADEEGEEIELHIYFDEWERDAEGGDVQVTDTVIGEPNRTEEVSPWEAEKRMKRSA